MKRGLALIPALILVFSLSACGVAQTEYDTVVSERNQLQAQYDSLKSEYDTLLVNTADWLALTETEKAAQLAQAEADRIAAEEAAEKAREEQAAAEKAAAAEAEARAAEAAAARANEEKMGYETGITFDALSRNPDSYNGKKVKFTGEVLQVVELTEEIQIRLATGVNSWGYSGDEIYLYFDSELIASRILEDDVITIYGVSRGLHSYTTVLGATVTLPLVEVDKIDGYAW